MNTFTMLIGIPASGKSTYALETVDENTVYLSSDQLRQDLYGDVNNQENNAEIFGAMREKTISSLKAGKSVIYDATNISRKKRKSLLTQIPKDVIKIAIYFPVHIEEALRRNKKRDRVVPKHVIERMYKNMQMPIVGEGWNAIGIRHSDNGYLEDNNEDEMFDTFHDFIKTKVKFGFDSYEDFDNFLSSTIPEYREIQNLPHDSTWHSFSVSRHTYYVFDYIFNNFKDEDTRETMLWTALLHDIGKGFCKSFKNRKGEDTRYANFIGHEHVSSQMAIGILMRLGFNMYFVNQVAELIDFHMYLLDENASKEKLKLQVGEEMFGLLEFMRDADTKAH